MKAIFKVALSAMLAATSLQVAVAADKPKLAFVVNAASDFWKEAEAGVKKAQAENPNFEMALKYPAQPTAAQQNALMDDLVAGGTKAIMISSADPKTSIDAFNRIAAQIPLFTTDSDAPQSKRIAYLGSSNTDAGVQAGEIAVKALPKGGKCMGFVGLLGADNAKERIAGFKKAIEGKGIELVDVRGDDVDFARARSNVDDVLVAKPEINCMVGYPVTLGAVKEGSFAATVVQQPFEWGYRGMKLMAAYLGGDKSGVPANGLIIVPTKVIDKDNVVAYQNAEKEMIGK